MSDRAKRTMEIASGRANAAKARMSRRVPDIDRATFGVRVPTLAEALCLPARHVRVCVTGASADCVESDAEGPIAA